MRRIVVTGTTGFIGSHIAEKLLELDYEIIGIDNLNDYYSPVIKKNNLKILRKFPGFKFKKLDIAQDRQINEIFALEKPEFLIHCAARAGVRASVNDPVVYTKTNVLGSQILLEAIRKHSPKTKSILLSSSSVYGLQDNIPFTENMRPNPRSPYGVSKYAMELIAEQYNFSYGIPIVVVRPFSIYGPRGRVDMAPFLVILATENNRPFVQFGNNDSNKRDWTFIDDFVDGVLGLMDNYSFKSFEVFNIGNEKPIGIEDFVSISKRMVKKYLKKELVVRKITRGEEELPITYASLTKIKSIFPYRPRTDFEEGLDRFYRYYSGNRNVYQEGKRDGNF